MRHIGSLKEKSHAEKFLAFLTSEDISAVVEQEEDNFEVWVKDEDQLDTANKSFDQFIENPDNPIYTEAIQKAREIRAQQQRKMELARKNVVSMQQHWNRPALQRAPMTMALIIASIGVFLFSGMGSVESYENAVFNAMLFMSVPEEQGTEIAKEYGPKSNELKMASIANGQVWRMVTPIFIHFTIAHIVFNMLWLFSLGQQVEAKFGVWKYLLIILAIAIASNTMQIIVPEEWGGALPYLIPTGNWLIPAGGMSGVVYGVFGIAWIRSRLDPNGGFSVSPFAVVIMLGWLVFCMLPMSNDIVGNVGNWAHGVGLIVGVTIGYWTLWWKFKTRNSPGANKPASKDTDAAE